MRVISAALVSLAMALAPVSAQADEGFDCAPSAPERPIALEAPILPADCAVTEQSPPDFSWPGQIKPARYRFVLTGPDGKSETRTVDHNWMAWPGVLAPGVYRWRVYLLPDEGEPVTVVMPRRFKLAATARPFAIPDWREMYARASALPHPRALPRGAARERFAGALLNERREGVRELIARADEEAAKGLGKEPPPGPSLTVIQLDTNDETKRALNAAFAWVVTKNPKYLQQAKRRAFNLARWDPNGSTGYRHHDIAAKSIAFTLSLIYDWLHDQLTPEERGLLLNAIVPRANDMFSALASGHGINLMPYDSHGAEILGKLAAISVLLAGEVPQAGQWLAGAVPLYLHSISPWGREDGGYANGTGYSLWDVGDSLTVWNVLHWTLDVDVAQKAWVRNYGRYLAYFLPPGAPRHAFGDGADSVPGENWARFAKAYALFAPSPLSRWYAAQLFGEDKARLEVLLAQRDGGGEAKFPENTPDAALFPSIGWVAMHSDLQDRNRTSVYFKSSPYGSFNHSHADQNGFVINARGHALAIDSGYYDAYHSAHWERWTTQTRAHNAITFDGGQGQTQHSIAAKGEITQFHAQNDMDFATGDATQAYGGALRKAVRSIVYARPDQVVVFDRLESDKPRRWEWNIHSIERMEELGRGKVRIHSGPVAMCVEVKASAPIRFVQDDQFGDAPRNNGFATGAMPNQWHGRFETVSSVPAVFFAASLSVDCQPGASIGVAGEERAFAKVKQGRVVFDGNALRVDSGAAAQQPVR